MSCAHGTTTGWLATAIPVLQSNDTPLINGIISMSEASWIGSLIAVGGISGNLIFGFISTRIGVKNTSLLLAFPNLIFWLFVLFGKYVEYLYIARIFTGLSGGGMFTCIPIYIAEISYPSIRGTLGNVSSIAYTIGTLLSYIIGTYVNYTTVPYIFMTLPITYFCGLLLLPDTPQYYLKHNDVVRAEKSLRFYRNCKDNKITNGYSFNEEFEKLKDVCKHEKQNDKLQLSDFCKPNSRKAIYISLLLIMLNSFSGCFVLISYTVTIFQKSGSDIDPHTSTIALGVIQLLGTYCSAMLVDRIGRKILLIVSTSGAAFGYFLFGTYSYMERHSIDVSHVNWIPVTSLAIIIFIASVGFMPISMIMIAEILPLKIRTLGLTMCAITISVYSFTTLKSFPVLAEIIDLYGCMWIFGSICALGVLFSVFIIKETKGKDVNVVDNI